MISNGNGNSWGIWGQDTLVSELQHAFPNSIRHSYVLSGPESSGKSSLAIAFAKALLCQSPPAQGEFCDSCRSCRTTTRGLHADMARFDLAWQSETTSSDRNGQTLSIDTIRQISRGVSMRPIEGRWRVIIVDDVETMQETAQEAFLKTLEEPPSYTVIILLTTDANTLLPTILSRCLQLHMGTVSTGDVRAALMAHGVRESEASETASMSQGLVGWAIRAIEQPELREQRRVENERALSWISGSRYERMVTAIKHAERFTADREALFEQLNVVMMGWRSLLLHRLDVIDRHPLFGPTLPLFGRGVSADGCAQAIESIRQCMFDLESNVRPRLAMQSMVTQWPELAA